jgi:hypothetical protein
MGMYNWLIEKQEREWVVLLFKNGEVYDTVAVSDEPFSTGELCDIILPYQKALLREAI